MPDSKSINTLPRTSAVTIAKFKKLHINTIEDLFNFYPNRYQDYSDCRPISSLRLDQKLTVCGYLTSIKGQITKRGVRIQKATIKDNTCKIDAIWFNQPYLIQLLSRVNNICISGTITMFGAKKVLTPDQYDIIYDPQTQKIHTGRIVPIYSQSGGLSSRTIREKTFFIHTLCKNNSYSPTEYLPKELIAHFDLLDLANAYMNIHFPENLHLLKKARQRLAFDEIFIIQLSSNLIRRQRLKKKSIRAYPLTVQLKEKIKQFANSLPFKLTTAQSRCIGEIISDLTLSVPANRLIQGDVGSGKTVVAAAAAYFISLHKYKTLIMAPTEILARQHYQTVSDMFGCKNHKLNVQLMTSTNKPSPLLINSADIIIGTHALIKTKHIFDRVGLVVIDEQHKFGVKQRAELTKITKNPHLLTMTATPIPRTIALTLFGELDISILDQMPGNRKKVKTYLVPARKRDAGYKWIAEKIDKEKIQVFVVCPLISESDAETLKSVKAANQQIKTLNDSILGKYRIELLHGKVKSDKKQKIMKDFSDGKIHILVSTPVVEVGIDVPNAAVIVIETPERFGLAQLHQLRGRVGRGEAPGFCLLFPDENSEDTTERLKIFAKENDGFALAEADLKLRGAGQIYGSRQHGLLDLKIASLSDSKLIALCSNAVTYFLNNYKSLDNFAILKEKIEAHRQKTLSHD